MEKNLKKLLYVFTMILAMFSINAAHGSCISQLFPLSCYGQAIEICMRVLADRMHQYDRETAIDLCVGRLVRLSDAVIQMEHLHLTKKPYPPEDITYVIALMGIVAKERLEDLDLSKTALSLVTSIESRLALLLRYP